ncbi:hypothetical protein SK128_000419 [Halocaridina rubra]|uniref:Uncharacterized protein n=1 Tax=Halocaridina rubra TaxID=373956 RepID=A0AAN9AF57_HALRR
MCRKIYGAFTIQIIYISGDKSVSTFTKISLVLIFLKSSNAIVRSEIYFRVNNPDGDKYQNCIRLHLKGLEDTECQKSSCSVCHAQAANTWTLRGICEDEERMYYLDMIPNPLSFRGYGEYAVQQRTDGRWIWINSVTNITMAILMERELNYPIGRLMWELQIEVCGQSSGERELTLSACTKSEFTCTDGSCIPFTRRCDLKFDCNDKTDESLCDIINYPEDYRSKLPPRPASDEALPISVNVSMDTLNVDTTTMLLSVSYNLRITWFDNRLTYNNLKQLTRLNTVSLTQVEKLWIPKIGFINTDDIQNTAVDQDAVTTILRQNKKFVPDLSNSYEVEIFQGDMNPVSITRKYFTIYTCNFDLVLYPFDIQNCYMQLQILSASSEYLIFNPSESFVEYLGSKYLVEYEIGPIDLQVVNTTQYSVLKVEVMLIRRYGYAILNIYIPSLTLIIISYITLFFRSFIFDTRIMTALTALLVLATLFTQVSTSLPKTSYFKMVDIWLLFCIILIFFIMVFHTIIDLHIDYGDCVGATDSTTFFKRRQNNSGVQRSSSGKVTKIDVKPSSEDNDIPELAAEESNVLGWLQCHFNLPFMKKDLQFYITASKWTVFIMFSCFNLIYWGTLAVGSGLVYYG